MAAPTIEQLTAALKACADALQVEGERMGSGDSDEWWDDSGDPEGAAHKALREARLLLGEPFDIDLG